MNARPKFTRALFLFICIIFLGVCLFPVSPEGGVQHSFGVVDAADMSTPDISGIRMVLPDSVGTGTYLRIIDTIRNRGTISSGPFSIDYALTDPSELFQDIILGSVNIQNLVPGGQKSVNISFPIPVSVHPGAYHVRRILNNPEQIISAGTNGYVTGNDESISVYLADESEIIGYNENPILSPDETAKLTILSTVQNTNATKPVETHLSFYLSETGLITDNLIFIGESIDLFIGPSEEKKIETNLILSKEIPPHDYYLVTSFLPPELITADSDLFWVSGEPVKFSSYEPVMEPPIQQVPVATSPEPDIMTVRTDYPEIMYIGDAVKVTDSITNIGGSTAGIVRVEYLLSSSEDGSDASHMDYWTIHNLKAGETRTSQETIGIPGNIRTGIYYLTKKITVTSNPPEKNTANNYWTGNRPVRIEYNPAARIPDLTHVTTKFPCGYPGLEAEISDTITNVGNACAEYVSVAYYISPYADFDPSTARYLGVYEINRIYVGEQLTHTITVTVPADLTNGEYYWYSVIDPCSFMSYCGDEMPELDKSNNINIGRFTIGPCVFCGC